MNSPRRFPGCLAGSLVALAAVVSLTAQEAAPAPAPKRVPPAQRDLTPATKELVLQKWSGEINVPDPVAATVDPQGRVYVSATTRRKVGDLDIREHTMWIPDDVAIDSVEAKLAFYRRELAPGKMRAPRGMLADHNRDGSIDIKDLTYHTERIYQLRDTDGDGTADKMTVFAEGFNTEVTGIAAGVLWHDGWVYATIAPDLWRLKDTDDDGVADVRERLVHGVGHHIAYAGHDMHGPMVGPDGRIYWSMGDKGINVLSKEGKRFYFPNEGVTMRAEPDGSGFEVYTRGNRNVQEPAFNEFGDLIGVDNDADQPGERERFVHLAEASDSGWRNNFQYMKTESPWMREGLWKPHHEGQPAYLLPPLLSYSDGPAGFKFEPGTALGATQRGMFLLNEFPSGKMKAFRAAQDGATFKMTDARVLNDGIMGIGLAWHPDGSLIMADWIGGYPLDGIGAVWRVDTKDAAKNPARAEVRALLGAGFGRRPEAELVSLLGHADQRVRQGAQLELAKRGRGAVLLGVAQDGKAAQLARIHALWGVGQLLRRSATDVAPVAALLRDADPELRAQAVKVLGDAAETGAKGRGRELVALLGDAAPRVRLQAAIALAKFREPTAVAPLLALAEKEGLTPIMRHAAATGLAGCATPAQLAAVRTHASVAVRLIAVVALRRQAAPEAAEFLRDADIHVVAEAARAIHDDTSIIPALPALAARLDATLTSEPVLRRAINAGLRLGTAAAAGRVLEFALDGRAPAQMRAEALGALRVWKNPPRLDLVDGWARTFKPEAIDAVLMPQLARLLALTEPKLKTLAIEIMIAHALKAAPDLVAPIVADAGAAPELRAQALRLMAAEHPGSPALATALGAALAAGSPAVLHGTALGLLLPRQRDRLVQEAQVVLATRSVPEKQEALALLAKAGFAGADRVLAEQGAALNAGKLAAALQLDVVEALRARAGESPTLANQLETYGASAAAKARRELLAGGDPVRGRDLAANHLAANCTACHSFETAGSEVGPNLRTIGAQRDAAYLLEALVEPSAQIATGYGLVAVTLKNKREFTGTLAKETPDAVSVRLFDGKTETVSRAEIAALTPPVSIMPPMAGVLQPRELRDLVAYLGSLKGGRGNRAPSPGGE